MLKMQLLKIMFIFAIIWIIVGGTNSAYPEESQNYFEGDIRLPRENNYERLEKAGAGEALAGGLAHGHRLWENGIVPYEISRSYNDKEKQVIQQAMDTISKETCIRFRPHGREENWIVFRPGKDCSSLVGRRRQEIRGQEITLDKDGCIQIGVIMHEILHALGLWHEQNRFDRDDHVRIHFENIIPAMRKNFDKHITLDFPFPYDYESIMHYGEQAFITDVAKKMNKTTIGAIKKGQRIGQRERLSPWDIKKINYLYNCSNSHRGPKLPKELLQFFFPIYYYTLAKDNLMGLQNTPSGPNKTKLTTNLNLSEYYTENGAELVIMRILPTPNEREKLHHHTLIIPYKISAGVDKPSRRKLRAAMVEISHKTCIKFQPREENENPFLSIQSQSSCEGDDGLWKNNGKIISTRKSACLKGKKGKIIALQQLLKAVGLWHGHRNSDEEILLDISTVTQDTGAWNIRHPSLSTKTIRKIKRKYCRKHKPQVNEYFIQL